MSNTTTKKQAEADSTVDVRVMKALGHPLRQRILQALNEEVASPNQVARKLGEPLSNVSYHVKILESCDAIELVDTKPVRGALEHFYRATMRARLEEEHWRQLPESVRGDLSNQTLQQLWKHVSEAAAVGGFNDPKAAVAWVELELDDEAYAKLGDEIVNLLNLATDLHAEAAVRLAELDDEERKEATHRTELGLLHFHRAE
ncbi:MAG: helix-turn-helix transcriptional regulator [Solirubrobacterales bacterium]|nr:helix-turn-helix transcriptional regulator [Solirubrobacterales bacterium]